MLNICFAQTVFRDKSFSFVGIERTEVSSTLNLDGVTKDLLLFEQNPRDNKLSYRVVYDKRFIDEELLSNFVSSYKKLFTEILEDLLNGNDGNRISSYSPLDQQQYHKIVYEFNQTEVEYPHDKTIQALFEEQVLKIPDNIAVVYEDNKLTYQGLNNKANQLANYLRHSYDIKPDDLIAMCLDRSEQMLIAILGVLKSGGAYVPLDPTYPDERIGYILDDTNTKVILTNSVYVNRLRQIIEKKRKYRRNGCR